VSARTRKALGLFVLLIGLLLYAGLAVHLGVTHVPEHWLAWLIYYPVAGILWVWPAKRLIWWMQAKD